MSLFLIVGTAAWAQCNDNNEDPPTLPMLCGDDDGDGVDDCIFIIDYQSFIDSSFCINTQDGCAQVMITNIPALSDDVCTPQFFYDSGSRLWWCNW